MELSIIAEADDLHLVVVDSGDGVTSEAVDQLFEQGYTTTVDDGRPHGIGLALARQLARRHGGDLELTRGSGVDCGAVFVARLSGAVARDAAAWPAVASPRRERHDPRSRPVLPAGRGCPTTAPAALGHGDLDAQDPGP